MPLTGPFTKIDQFAALGTKGSKCIFIAPFNRFFAGGAGYDSGGFRGCGFRHADSGPVLNIAGVMIALSVPDF